jgi:TfoX N-terminal domain
MGQETWAAEQRFAILVDELSRVPDVTPPSDGKAFGSSGLKVHGKIFAMLVGGSLVVKLPRARVDALIAAGDGERFDPRRDGRAMKEWLVLDPASAEDWLTLSREALAFVAAGR